LRFEGIRDVEGGDGAISRVGRITGHEQ
jgi:hypothetical protein